MQYLKFAVAVLSKVYKMSSKEFSTKTILSDIGNDKISKIKRGKNLGKVSLDNPKQYLELIWDCLRAAKVKDLYTITMYNLLA